MLEFRRHLRWIATWTEGTGETTSGTSPKVGDGGFGEDPVGGFGPDEGVATVVPAVDESGDLGVRSRTDRRVLAQFGAPGLVRGSLCRPSGSGSCAA